MGLLNRVRDRCGIHDQGRITHSRAGCCNSRVRRRMAPDACRSIKDLKTWTGQSQRTSFSVGLPVAGAGIAQALLNWYRFGNPFEFGYGDEPSTGFTTPIYDGIGYLLWSSGKGLSGSRFRRQSAACFTSGWFVEGRSLHWSLSQCSASNSGISRDGGRGTGTGVGAQDTSTSPFPS